MKKNIKMDGTLILIIVSVLIPGVVAVKAHLSDKKKEIELNNKTEKIINLQEDLNKSSQETNSKQSELIEEQRKNIVLSEKILDFQEKLDQNTTQLSSLTKSIEKITRTNSDIIKSNAEITKLISNEQKAKGTLDFRVLDVDMYRFSFGGGTYNHSSASLESGVDFNSLPFFPIPLFIKKDKDQFLISTRLYNNNGEMLVEIIENEWSINKNCVYSINFDSSGIEVIDSYGRLILQILINKNQFYLTMLVYDKLGTAFITPENGVYNRYESENYKKVILPFTFEKHRIFKHEGKNYIGIRKAQKLN